jgi:hypothetical protein
MSETPSLSVVEVPGWCGCEARPATLRSQVQVGEPSRPRPRPASGGGGGGPSCASGVGRRVESADGAVHPPTAG